MKNYTKRLLMLMIITVNVFCNDSSDNNGTTNGVLKKSTDGDLNETVKGKVIFEDDFNQTGKTPDTSKWALCSRYIGDPYISQSYDQAYVENGKLILKAEKVGGVYKTGGVWTQNLFDFTYGKVEVSARFFTAKGGWPAIWLLSYPINENTGELDGEIDIMEQYNNKDVVNHTVHSYYTMKLKHDDFVNQAFAKYNVDEFNTYAVEWTPEKIVFSVNGQVTFIYPNLHLYNESTMRQWSFKKPFYVIMNYALGGGAGTISDSQLPARMEVDWIRITQ